MCKNFLILENSSIYINLIFFFSLIFIAKLKPGQKCHTNEFLCRSGDQCILKGFVCDSETDCADNSDELKCGN